MLSLDLRNEEQATSSILNSVKLPSPSPQPPIIPSPQQSKDLQKMFEGISKSSVASRLSELHKVDAAKRPEILAEESSAMLTSETLDVDQEFVMVRRDSNKSSSSESSFHRKQLGSSSSEKSTAEDKPQEAFRKTYSGSEMASPNNAQYEKYIESTLEEDDPMNTNEHKPIPKSKQLMKINSTDLLHRQIKDTMMEQVMCEDDDSMMSESSIHKDKDTEFQDSAISMGKTEGSSDMICSELMTDGEGAQLSRTSPGFRTADEIFVEEPDWEIIQTEKDNEEKEAYKRSMTPEQALEIASDIVQQVQTEAVKRYEEIVRSQTLPKPSPDSKFTPETKEKVQVYLKELEESEQYDHVEAELITNIVSKKEERFFKNKVDVSVDITDEEPRSDNMLSELRNELHRSSVTDEDLVSDMTHELLEEKNIEEMKRHLAQSEERDSCLPSDFKFQTSFRTHFVKEKLACSKEDDVTAFKTEKVNVSNEESEEIKESNFSNTSTKDKLSESQVSEDIWAEESKNISKKELIIMREKKSDNESISSGSKQGYRRSGTDQEGYSSSGGETFFTAEHQTSGASRPSSSDVDAMLSAVSEKSTTDNTEYVTAQDISSADTSFFTAPSTLSSRGSVISSESSGHLGSVEVSECSETLVESSLDYDPHFEGSDTPSTFKHLDDVMEDMNYQSVVEKSSFEKHTTFVESSSVSRDLSIAVTKSSEVKMLDASSSSLAVQESPQEIQLLAEDDVDGCCLSRDKLDDESEREYLIQEDKHQFGSVFSESRETLSSSVLTLSSISEATVMGNDSKSQSLMFSSQISQEVQKQAEVLSCVLDPVTETKESKSQKDEEDQVFPLPRMRSIEGAHSVQISIPQELSIDMGSEYDSRPSSELRDVESRPLSAEKMSRPNSQQDHVKDHQRRAFSIDETVSDNLRVNEPFTRPISPMPQSSFSRPESESDDFKLKVSVSAPIRSVSPQPRRLQSEESFEAEIAFSQHFTQVLDESEFETSEIIKTNESENILLTTGNLMDLTPESANTSESMETSQGQDYFLEMDTKDLKARSPKLQYDLDDSDDLLVGSPPMLTRPLGVKYWPPIDNLDQESDGACPVDKRSIARSESDDNSESRLEIDNDMIDKEVESGKRWLENQFEEVPDEFGNFSYGQPLDQILEEEEEHYSHSSEEMKELAKFKESLSSTPDFDAIVNKRHQVSRSVENDDLSMGSLTEFERLEREVALGSGSGSRGSLGSNDSLEVSSNGNSNGNGKPLNLAVKLVSKTGGDDISVSSLDSTKSFEMMEKACAEATVIEEKARKQEEVLSEIEEGHESQVSESESCETMSDCGGEKSDEDNYEERIFEIDSIIKQAQANVEQFDTAKVTEEISLAEILGSRPESRTESITSHDSLDEAVPEIAREPPLRRQSSIPTRITSAHASRTTSVTSLYSVTSVTSASTLTQYDADSLRDRDEDFDMVPGIMQASVDSLDHKLKSPDNTMITSTDSLEPNTPRTADKMTISTDSIENGKSTDPMTVSIDSLDDNGKDMFSDKMKEFPHEIQGAASMLFTSTDSIESCSTNTRATASMLSSITSQGSETLVADDELEYDDEESKSAMKYLINQGNIHFEDSDDSTTCSHSSPQLPTRLYHKDLSGSPVTRYKRYQQPEPAETAYVSSEETVETEEIDEKGNMIIKKVIQKRFVKESSTKSGSMKQEGYVSDISEKKDDSCEETIEEVDEFGNRRIYVVKRSIETKTPNTLEIVQERRHQQGLSPIREIFKPLPESQS